MGKFNFSKVVKDIQTTVVKRSPEILIALGVTGMISSAVMAVRATPKALELIEEEKERLTELLYEDAYELDELDECTPITRLEPLDVVRVTWKCYLPAIITGSVSVACIIGANSVNAKRNAALATAYTLSETAFKEYKDKVVETIGEKKEEAVRDKVAKERVEKNPVKNNEVHITGKGETLCYDVISGRYFKSDSDKIRRIENSLNKRLRSEMYISLNEFYYEVGLPCVKLGHDLGWNIDGGDIDLSFSSQLTEDDTPCLVIDYRIAPRYDFRTLM